VNRPRAKTKKHSATRDKNATYGKAANKNLLVAVEQPAKKHEHKWFTAAGLKKFMKNAVFVYQKSNYRLYRKRHHEISDGCIVKSPTLIQKKDCKCSCS